MMMTTMTMTMMTRTTRKAFSAASAVSRNYPMHNKKSRDLPGSLHCIKLNQIYFSLMMSHM
jgi:hypothetical protein